MFGFVANSHRVTLRELDLHLPPIGRECVVPLTGRPCEVQVEHVGGDDFSNTADEVAVEGELSTWKQCFQATGGSVKLVKQTLHLFPIDRFSHAET